MGRAATHAEGPVPRRRRDQGAAPGRRQRGDGGRAGAAPPAFTNRFKVAHVRARSPTRQGLQLCGLEPATPSVLQSATPCVPPGCGSSAPLRLEVVDELDRLDLERLLQRVAVDLPALGHVGEGDRVVRDPASLPPAARTASVRAALQPGWRSGRALARTQARQQVAGSSPWVIGVISAKKALHTSSKEAWDELRYLRGAHTWGMGDGDSGDRRRRWRRRCALLRENELARWHVARDSLGVGRHTVDLEPRVSATTISRHHQPGALEGVHWITLLLVQHSCSGRGGGGGGRERCR